MKHLLIDMDDTLYLHGKKLEYDKIKEDERLTYLCEQCIYPKYIYTNATFEHADLILEKMKLSKYFTTIYARNNLRSMKPDINSAISIEKDINSKFRYEQNSFVFFDDLLVNLKTGKDRRWTTFWISPLYQEKDRYPFVDYAFPNMKLALDYFNKYKL